MTMRKICSLLLLLLLGSGAVSAKIITGKCGENLTWELNTRSGELVIRGEGDMRGYHHRPWADYGKKITSARFDDGVTRITYNCFAECPNLKNIEFPKSLESIGREALDNTAWYKNQPDGVVYVGDILYK